MRRHGFGTLSSSARTCLHSSFFLLPTLFLASSAKYAPHLDLTMYPPARNVTSTHNTSSESKWSFLRKYGGRQIRSHIENGWFLVDSMEQQDQ